MRHAGALTKHGLHPDTEPADSDGAALQTKQQQHFDWYAANATQTYAEYERTPFWQAADRLAYDPWRSAIRPGRRLLDVGCAQGRSTFKLMDLDVDIVGFDLSKPLIRQAIQRYRSGAPKARATFFAADASAFPLVDNVFDYVLIYGVLHHLPDPSTTCREVSRVLKPGGAYFGSENNCTVFRAAFDWLQKVNPIWHEEAGPEALISDDMLRQWFAPTDVSIATKTSVFLPPHLINLVPKAAAYQLLRSSDQIGRLIPFLRDNGGLIIVQGTKH
jgi:ubiquinone/menaquinone biosynthesis C-methylase UbiE